MASTKSFYLFLIAVVVAVIASATALGGPCPGGFWPDGSGCCPLIIKGSPYYRDQNNQCYPKQIGSSIFYADSNGCYPDANGRYVSAGKSCPRDQKCHSMCVKPGGSSSTTTHKQSTTTQERTTTPRRTTPRETTTTKEMTTTPRETTTTKEMTTTPRETTTTKQETTTTKQQTTTPRETTTTKEMTTTPRETTTTKQQTTTQKHAQCPGDKKKDRNGCCPRLINGKWYYRDGRGCYPTETPKGVFYADGNGCYPNDYGVYLKAGQSCPYERKCMAECDCGYGSSYDKRDYHDDVDFEFAEEMEMEEEY